MILPANWFEILVRLTLLLALSYTKMLDSKPVDNSKRKENDQLRIFYLHDRGTPTLVQDHNLLERRVRIYSKGSGKNVRIMGKQIDSLGSDKSDDTILIIESVGFAVIRIKSATSNFYLCMSKKGTLVGKRNGKTSPRCMFVVEDDNPFAYIKYVSLAHPSYRVSFNKNGRPRHANRVPSIDHKSVLFVERPVLDQKYYTIQRIKREQEQKILPTRRDPCKTLNSDSTNHVSRLRRLYCEQRLKELMQTHKKIKRLLFTSVSPTIAKTALLIR